MVKALLNFCKATCASGLFVLPNYKLSELVSRTLIYILLT